MNPKYHPLRAFTLASLLLATTAHADLPLGLEGITPRQNRLDLGVSLTYYNHSNTAPRQGNSSYLLTPQNTLIEIPGHLEEGKNNSDTLYSNLNVQYGLSEHNKIYANLGSTWRNDRYSNVYSKNSKNGGEMNNITLGINHVFINDGENPAVIDVLETGALKKNRRQARIRTIMVSRSKCLQGG